jgi:nucleotide-binding universal stress UspA family protein
MTAAEDAVQRRIVVGVDGSDQSRKALRWGAQLAANFGARLEVLGAWDYPPNFGWSVIPENWDPAADTLKNLQETVREVFGDQPPVDVEIQVRQGGAARVLIDAAQHANLLIVGSRGHGGFAGMLLGSVSEIVAEHSPCPVLIIHGDQDPPKLDA